MFGIHSIEYDGLTSFFYLFAALENGSDWLAWDHVTELASEIGVPTVPIRCQKQVSDHNIFLFLVIITEDDNSNDRTNYLTLVHMGNNYCGSGNFHSGLNNVRCWY